MTIVGGFSILAVAVAALLWLSFKSKRRLNEGCAAAGVNSDPDLRHFQELFHKLHNLERFPDILQEARNTLIHLLAEALESAMPTRGGILSVDTYSADSASAFVHSRNLEILRSWDEYIKRRKTGPRELVPTLADAIALLVKKAPCKLVDGAWLGYVHTATTPYALRPTTKTAWQIFSEELGDGCNDKNHVSLYRRLLLSTGVALPEPHSKEFLEPGHGMTDPRAWKSGVGQLLISLFPHDFLPEILGFNLHFEGLALETLVLTRELQEVALDPSYFRLHVTIDNAASGHTAMAVAAVHSYMQFIGATGADTAVRDAWRRIQAGYVLSECLGEDHSPLSPAAAAVGDVFLQKAVVSQNMHCSCRGRIGGRSLEEWLDPTAFRDRRWQSSFLAALAASPAWVRKGDGARSKLVKELLWGGKMFGSFTEREVEVVKSWIDELGRRPDASTYWSFASRQPGPLARPAILNHVPPALCVRGECPAALPPITPPTIRTAADLHVSRFFAIWFTHPCLLETTVSIPSRAATEPMACVLKVLRAQNGLGELEGGGVAGMDEVKRLDAAGLIDLGLQMATVAGRPLPSRMEDVIEMDADYTILLKLAARPQEHLPVLLGISWAFVGLHRAIADSDLLRSEGQAILHAIAAREEAGLSESIKAAGITGGAVDDVCRGYRLGTDLIDSCIVTSRAEKK
ncbi:hypothetical protein B0J12DRAFT_775433 [Macrophomina phaseolina]|uniref:Uncharacterized protein n=1 Tax=Macrophomina phaseolina TaxID=35725 RepID=A0ABQ8FUF2_9PEZI|nr:hypothetical protein B0J12DRAFT_775433 [Macrophomina phaseolina]